MIPTMQDMDKLEVIGHAPHDITLDSLGEEESYSEDSLSGSEDITPPSNQSVCRGHY